MKTKLFLIMLICIAGIFIYSCNSEPSQKDSIKIDRKKLKIIEDSLRNAERIEFINDSIYFTKIKGFSTSLISGNHTYGGKTSIEYKSIFQLLSEIEENAEKQMWTQQEKELKINAYKNTYRGGQITLKIERNDIDQANTEWFSIIIKDLKEVEKYRFKLKNDIPKTPIGNDYWWNLEIVGLNERIEIPFYVYVVDQVANTSFKFRVNEKK